MIYLNYNMDISKKLIEESGEDLVITPEGKITYKGKVRKHTINGHGYYRVTINNKSYSVHRLMCEKFKPNPDNKPQVNHIDGDKGNNQLSNLEWATREENMQHAVDTKLLVIDNEYKRKLTPTEVKEIRSKYTYRVYHTNILAKEYGVSGTAIRRIINGESYKDIF